MMVQESRTCSGRFAPDLLEFMDYIESGTYFNSAQTSQHC